MAPALCRRAVRAVSRCRSILAAVCPGVCSLYTLTQGQCTEKSIDAPQLRTGVVSPLETARAVNLLRMNLADW